MTNAGEAAFPYKGSLDPLLTSELRFYIMTVLAMYHSAEFNFLKQQLEASDGNLSVSLSKLEEAGYIVIKKEFVGKKPRSTYTISPTGLQRLSSHLDSISKIRKDIQKEDPQ